MISHDLFTVGIPLVEKALRTVLVYGGLAVLLRLAGKRELAQLNSFDLVVMLLLSNVVQNAIIGHDESLWGGLFGAAVLIGVNTVVVRTVRKKKLLDAIFEGRPTVLVRDGKFDDAALARVGLRRSDVHAALLRQGAGSISEVGTATLEPGGAILVELLPEAQNATKRDLAALEQRLLAAISGISP